MPVRVSKSALARSRGVEIPTSVEVGLPSMGVFDVTNKLAYPVTPANTYLNPVTIQWRGWATDEAYMRVEDAKVILAPGSYKLGADLSVFAVAPDDITTEGAVTFTREFLTSGPWDLNAMAMRSIAKYRTTESYFVTAASEITLDYLVYRSNPATVDLLVDGFMSVERLGDYAELLYF